MSWLPAVGHGFSLLLHLVQSICRHIDHTALRPETTEGDIRQLCMEAARWNFAAICVMPFFVPIARHILDDLGAHCMIAATIGFPIGTHQTVVKVAEARRAISDGAMELDMVINVGALKSGHQAVVKADVAAVADAAHERGAIVKAIIETSLLDDAEKRLACELACLGGTDFVKTSTGFFGGGATLADIGLMRDAVPSYVAIKASGGIRDLATARAMLEAGAIRIGTSSGVAIAHEEESIRASAG